jgi:DNA processing protein
VLGTGLDKVYPPENIPLANEIIKNGALLAEVAPSVNVAAPYLVARNRIITGLSQVVVVVETDDPGGALHAVRFARLQKRQIVTVDFPAAGNQRLIKENAFALSPDESGIQTLIGILPHWK